MYYADCHTHSSCSFDAENTMAEMAAAAASYGLSEICFTDHCDILGDDLKTMESWSWDDIKAQFMAALLENGRDIKLRLGIELAGVTENTPLADSIASEKELDFVIGSVHVIPRRGDCYDLDYPDGETCKNVIDEYIRELERLTAWGKFDVLGHITYPLRYIRSRTDFDITYEDFIPRIETIFRKLIENGRGIELNTSNLKNGGWPMPYKELLELYRSCGGEIITTGSDAHCTDHVGSGIPHGCDLLSYCGFKYYTVFDHRKPEFIKL